MFWAVACFYLSSLTLGSLKVSRRQTLATNVFTNIRQDNQRVVQDREDLFAGGGSGMMFMTSCLTSVSKIAIPIILKKN